MLRKRRPKVYRIQGSHSHLHFLGRTLVPFTSITKSTHPFGMVDFVILHVAIPYPSPLFGVTHVLAHMRDPESLICNSKVKFLARSSTSWTGRMAMKPSP